MLMPSPSVPLRGAIASLSCAERSEEACLRLSLGGGTPEKLAALVEQALPVFRDASDDLALFIAHLAHSDIDWRAWEERFVAGGI